mgnify:CR=1 FL=1
MPGETTENNAPNTQITNNEEGNKVHYHLSANVKFNKKNAFNGTTNPDGNYDNNNKETICHYQLLMRSKSASYGL